MNRNTTIVLVVLFAALLIYLLAVQLPKDRVAAEATPTVSASASTPLWAVTADQITGVRLVNLALQQSVAFSKDAQGIWSVTEPEAQPADQAQASNAAAQIAGLSVGNTITTATDLASFGVLSPTYSVEVKLADGAQHTALIGSKAPTGRGYYTLRDGAQGEVLVVNASGVDTVLALLASPPYVVPTATPTQGGADFLATLSAIGGGAVGTPPAPTATP